MNRLHVSTSPLTNRIYAGSVLRDGQTWTANKTDVTGEACAAVAMHALEHGGPVVVTENGVPKWEITVREMAAAQQPAQAAPGDDDYMCPNCNTPWKCNGPHLLPGDDAAGGG
jgi:hypothetical protein